MRFASTLTILSGLAVASADGSFFSTSAALPAEEALDAEMAEILGESGVRKAYTVPMLDADAQVELLETFQERNAADEYGSEKAFAGKFVHSEVGCDGADGCHYKGEVDRAAHTSSHPPSFAHDTVSNERNGCERTISSVVLRA